MNVFSDLSYFRHITEKVLFYFFQQEADNVNRSYDMGCGHAGGFIHAGRNLKKYKNILKIYIFKIVLLSVLKYTECVRGFRLNKGR